MFTRPLPLSPKSRLSHLLVSIALSAFVSSAGAHGDVTPQAVDTQGLPQLGKDLLRENPFRTNATAVKIGASAYNQNCARCHGLEAISGGVAPDLRKMDNDCAGLKVDTRKKACVAEMDQYYANTVYKGKVRNGAVYMPPFAGILSQEAVWAIKSYLETRRERPL